MPLYIEIIGIVSSIDFFLAEAAGISLVNAEKCPIHFKARPMNRKEYLIECRKLCTRYEWNLDSFVGGEKSVLAWREMPSVGGVKDLIGDYSNLMEYFYEQYGLRSSCEPSQIKALIPLRIEIYFRHKYLHRKKKMRKIVLYGAGSDRCWRGAGLLCQGLLKLKALQDKREGGLELVLFDRGGVDNRNSRLAQLASDLNRMATPVIAHKVTVQQQSLEMVLRRASVLVVLDNSRLIENADKEELTDKELMMNRAEMIEVGSALAGKMVPRYLRVVMAMNRWGWLNATLVAEMCRHNGARINTDNIVVVTAHPAIEPLPYLCHMKEFWPGDVKWPEVWGLPGVSHVIDSNGIVGRTRKKKEEHVKYGERGLEPVESQQEETYLPRMLREGANRKKKVAASGQSATKMRCRPTRSPSPETWNTYNTSQIRNAWKYVAHHKEMLMSVKSPEWCYVTEVRAILDLLDKWFDEKTVILQEPTSLGIRSDGRYGMWPDLYASQPAVLNEDGVWVPDNRRRPPRSVLLALPEVVDTASLLLRRNGVGFSEYNPWIFQFGELTEKPSLMLLKTAQKRWENDMYEERPQFYEACETKGQPAAPTLAKAVKDEDCKTKKLPTENSENSSGTEDVPAVKAEEKDMPNSLRPDLVHVELVQRRDGSRVWMRRRDREEMRWTWPLPPNTSQRRLPARPTLQHTPAPEKDTGKTNGAEHDNFYKISLWEGPKDKFDGHPLKPTRKREHLPSPVEENEGRETTGSKISMEENESLCQSWSSMYSNGFEDEFGFTLYWSLIQMSLLELLMEMELFETFRQLAMAVIQKRNGSKEGSEELRDMPILEKIIESSHQEECDLRQRRSGNQEISSQQGSKGQRKTVLGKSWADNLLEECLEEEVQILSQMGELWGLIEYARGEKHGRTVGKSLVEMMRQEGLEEELEALRKLATSSRAQLSLLAEGRAMAVAYRRGAGSALEDRQSSLLLDYASEYLSWMRATIRQRPPAKSSLAAQLAAKATMSLVSPASHISLTKPSKASAAPLSKPRKINYDTTSIHLPDGLVESAITNGLRRAKRPAEAAITLQGLTEPRNLDDLEETTREADEPGPDISLFQNKELYLDAAVQYWSRWLPQNCI